jgi:hypothetical protein
MPNFEIPQAPQVEKDGEMEAFERTTAKVKELVADSESQEELEAKLEEAGIKYFQINWHNPGDEGFEETFDNQDPILELMPQHHFAKNGAQVYVNTDPNAHF